MILRPSWRYQLILLMIVLIMPALTAHAFDIVIQGEARSVIVIPDAPLPAVQYAAEELRDHVRLASGAELPIVRESDAPDGPELIYLGETEASRAAGVSADALEPNAFVIRLMDGRLFMVGHDDKGDPLAVQTRSGTLFAVYEFLERHLGVRWLWPGPLGTHVPSQSDIYVDRWDQQESPRLAWTDWRNAKSIIRPDLWPDPSIGRQFIRDQAQWKKRLRIAGTHDIRAKHSFERYWEQFHEEHPDYFNLLPDGTRRPLDGDNSGSCVTLCVSNPALHDRIVSQWEERGRPPRINLGENDSPGMCVCDNCRAWDAPDPRFRTSPYWGHGVIPTRAERFRGHAGVVGDSAAWSGRFDAADAPSLSDRYARFYLTIQQKAAEIDPDVTVTGFAYADYWNAPKQTTLNEHILITYVPPLWFPYTERLSKKMREHWDGWRATGAQVMLRPNLTHAGHAFPIWYVQPMVDDFRYVIEHGSVAMDFDSLTGSWATQGPTMYALARIIQRPEMTSDEILEEYYEAFGPASSQVAAYFDHWAAVSRTVTEADISAYYDRTGGGGSFKDWVQIADFIFTPPVMERGRHLLERARRAAKGDALATARVEFLAKGLRQAELTLDTLKAYKTYNQDKSARNEAALARAAKALYDYRASIQGDHVAAIGYLASREPALWRELAR